MSIVAEPTTLPYSNNSTSRDAARMALRDSTITRRAVYNCLSDAAEGMTDRQMQDLLGLDGNTQRPRRLELIMMGLVRDSGRKMLPDTGKRRTPVIVWERVPGTVYPEVTR
jgi:hypothetical protein